MRRSRGRRESSSRAGQDRPTVVRGSRQRQRRRNALAGGRRCHSQPQGRQQGARAPFRRRAEALRGSVRQIHQRGRVQGDVERIERQH